MSVSSGQEFIGRTLQRVYKQIHTRLVSELHNRGYSDITSAQAELLSCIANEGSSIVALAKMLGITKQAAGELIKQLEAVGYITKSVSIKDARSYVVILGERGQQLTKDAAQLKKRIEQEYRGLLGTQKFEVLVTGLQQLLVGE